MFLRCSHSTVKLQSFTVILNPSIFQPHPFQIRLASESNEYRFGSDCLASSIFRLDPDFSLRAKVFDGDDGCIEIILYSFSSKVLHHCVSHIPVLFAEDLAAPLNNRNFSTKSAKCLRHFGRDGTTAKHNH